MQQTQIICFKMNEWGSFSIKSEWSLFVIIQCSIDVFQDSMTANAHGINRDWTLQYVTYHASCIKCGQMWNIALFSVKILSQSLCTVVAHKCCLFMFTFARTLSFFLNQFKSKFHAVARFCFFLNFIFEVEGRGKKNPARPITENSQVLLFHNLRELAPCETFQVSPCTPLTVWVAP